MDKQYQSSGLDEQTQSSFEEKDSSGFLCKEYADQRQYEEALAKRMGFDSLREYKAHFTSLRQESPLNKALGLFINQKLSEMNISRIEFAKRLGLNRTAVHQYVSGITLPHKNIQEKLFSELGVSYKSIEDFVDDKGYMLVDRFGNFRPHPMPKIDFWD